MIKMNGAKLALQLEKQIKNEIKNNNIRLDIIQIGDDYSSNVYIRKKIITCKRLNIKTKLWKLNQNISQNRLIELINKLNKNKKTTGILLQLPIPKYLNCNYILKQISPYKDVDVFNLKSLKLKTKNNEKLIPCLVGAIDTFIKKYKIELNNKNIVVIGKGKTGGGPIIKWYKNKYNVISLDKKSKNIDKQIKNADILISAIGKNKIINGDWIKKGSAFFDIGFTRDKNNNIVGDIDYEKAKKYAKWGTPVPGGIGPLTVIMLIKNLITLYKIQNE